MPKSHAIKKSVKLGSFITKNRQRLEDLFKVQDEIADLQKSLAKLKQKESALLGFKMQISDDELISADGG